MLELTSILEKIQEEQGSISLKGDNLQLDFPEDFNNHFLLGEIKAKKQELIEYLKHKDDIPLTLEENFIATSGQKRLWLLSQSDEGSRAYHITRVFETTGVLDVEVLKSSILYLIDRHEILRTSFYEKSGELYQRIQSSSEIEIDVDFVKNKPEYNRNILISDLSSRDFDLASGPLLRFLVLKEGAITTLAISMHHIITDGWSFGVFINELIKVYESNINSNNQFLDPLKIQFKDYALWNKKRVSVADDSKVFWQEQLKGELPVLDLPTNHIRTAVKSFKGGNIDFEIDSSKVRNWKSYFIKEQTTLYIGLLSGFYALLSRYTSQKDFVVGSVTTGRDHLDLHNQIGFYTNTIPLRVRLEKSSNFKYILENTRANFLATMEHHIYPFDQILDCVSSDYVFDRSRNPLFDCMLILQNNEKITLSDNGLQFSQASYESDSTGFDFSFIFSEDSSGSLKLSIEYNLDLFEEWFIKQFGDHFIQLMDVLIDNPFEQISRLNYLTVEEKDQLLEEFNDTIVDYPKDKTIVDLFEEQVEKTPDNIAVVFEGVAITYKELSEKSNQLAHYLLELYKIQPEDLVGVKLERSEWLIISILAILKAGGAYVPIDPNYPKQRIEYIEKDTQCRVTIDKKLVERFEREKGLLSIESPNVTITPDNLAYVIYTSGSTGKPKGVMIEQKSIFALINWSANYFDLKKFEILYFTTSHCFDLSVFEIFFPLSHGKRIRILENGLSIPEYLNRDQKVLVNTVPSVVQTLLKENIDLSNISILNVAGEVVPSNFSKELPLDKISTHNLYGPSEDTTYSMYYNLRTQIDSSIPVGKPIDNTQIYILSTNNDLQPIGVPGELCISGLGLSRGYLNRPELTREKFIAHPFKKGEKLYKTGDLARWLTDGNIEFLGRNDFQVKIRGYRIELGEIEHSILSFEGIDQVVVLGKTKNDETILNAYLTGNTIIDKVKLGNFLKKQLPDYMMPSYFIQLEEFPLTSNGKINRKALPDFTEKDIVKKVYVGPKTDIEKQLVTIWQEVLGVKKIGITDNFFELGGHSLKAVKVVNTLHAKFNQQITIANIFINPTIEALAKLVKQTIFSHIPRARKQDSYPLTSSQRRLWILSQFEEGNKAYTIPGIIEFKGEINITTLQKAFDHLIHRHQGLRTVFKQNAQGEVNQYILEDFLINIDTKEIGVAEKLSEIDTFINRSFDIEKDLLLKATLLQLPDDCYILVYVIHHLVSDGWSMEILSKELLQTYRAIESQNTIELPELSIQYKDYAVWQNSDFYQKQIEDQSEYWLKQFEGELPVLELPSFKKRPFVKTYNGQTIHHTFSKEFTTQTKSFLSGESGTSLFMLLMTGLNSLFYRYTGDTDIILGTPLANRYQADLENQVGLYLNTLAIRTQFERTVTFRELIDIQRKVLLGGFANQSYPFDDLVDNLQLSQDTSRSALFDVMVVLQNQFESSIHDTFDLTSNLEATFGQDIERVISHFDMTFSFVEKGSELSLDLAYNTDIYDKEIVTRLITHLEHFILSGIQHTDQLINEIDYLSLEEKNQLLCEFNNTAVDYPSDKTIVDLFEEQVSRTPDNIAIVFEGAELTYRELDEKSNQLAHHLLGDYKVQKGDLIGICLCSRLEYLLASLLGVLKTGCGYVLLDHNLPEERITYILEDSTCKLLINDDFLDRELPFIGNQDNSRVALEINSEDIVYVMYTSGSTGKPKGAINSHIGFLNTITWYYKDLGITSQDRVGVISNLGFDLTQKNYFAPLLVGARVYLSSTFDPLLTSDFISKNGISIINCAPSLFYILLEREWEKIRSLDKVILGGESINYSLIKDFSVKNQTFIYNSYGPSEASDVTTYYELFQVKNNKTIPIGKPIRNISNYILDKDLNILPIGAIGELCISGVGLSRGYLNKSELTKEKFIDHPFKEGKKLYKTGDLARWLSDGNIEFLGRNDFQVKIRGHRIELGEIEHSILSFEGIDQVVVVGRTKNNETTLNAYIIGNTVIDKTELTTFLKGQLLDYMVPSCFIQLEELPLTSSGKVNRKALPDPTEKDIIKKAYVAPKTEIEKQLVAIWQEVLGVKKIGITDNFFELGGHSLKAVKVVNELYIRFNKHVDIGSVFINPTVAMLSEYIQEGEFVSIPKITEASYYQLSSSQKRLWILSQFEGGNKAYTIPFVLKIEGNLDIDILEKSLKYLIERHESLRTRFVNKEKKVYQQVVDTDQISFELKKEDVSEDKVKELIQVFYQEEFDLSKAPLIKAYIIQTSTTDYYLLFAIHHIIGDGWSMQVFIKELMYIYDQYLKGETISLSQLKIQYKDYVQWLESNSRKEDLLIQGSYWQDKLSGEIPVLELPTYKKRPLIKTYNGSTKLYSFSKELSEELNQFSKEQGATLYMSLLAGINGLFCRYTGATDIILGAPIAGRSHKMLEDQIGLYLNTLAIRTQFNDEDSFASLLHTQKETLLEAYSHQDYPFDRLVEDLEIQRDTSRSALFDVMVVLQNQQEVSLEREDIKMYPYQEQTRSVSQLDMTFLFTEDKRGIHLRLEYNNDIYEPDQMEALCVHLERYINAAITSPDEGIMRLSYLTNEEVDELLNSFNDTKSVQPSLSKSIVHLFEEQVQKTPDKIALSFKEKELTYLELNTRSNQFAEYLVEVHMVSSGSIIGIQLQRSEMAISAMLGVLKLSCKCVPISKDTPNEKLKAISKNIDHLVDQKVIDVFATSQEQYSKDNLEREVEIDSVAYIIYTSGSTGVPKGVMIEHQGIVNNIYYKFELLGLTEDSVISHTSKLHFVGGIWQIWTPLVTGGKLVLNTLEEIQNIALILDNIEKEKVEVLEVIPSQLNNVFAIGKESKLKTLKKLILTGEPLSERYVNNIFDINPEIEIINTYGQTECSDVTTYYQMTERIEDKILVGQPIRNMQNYVLDNNGALVPKGVVGEVCTSGIGVSRGYINQQDLTAQSFVNHPYRSDSKLYKTGDLGRVLPNGMIELFGRKDYQVKLRGYRIDIREIENAFFKHKEIENVIVLSQINSADEQELRAFIVSETEQKGQDLRAFLKHYLPDYMLPSSIAQLDEFPLLPNGKLNKKALSFLENEGIVIGEEYVVPQTDVEKSLVTIWEQVLDRKSIGVNDDFFALGGHSIKAVRIIFEIKNQFGVDINIGKIFETPTIKNLATEIDFINYQKDIQSKETALKEIEI